MTIKPRGRLARFGVALLASSMMTVLFAAGAQAAQWYVNGESKPLQSSEATKCSASEPVSLTTNIGTAKVTLTATGMECLNAHTFNSEGLAERAMQLKFPGFTVAGAKLGCTAQPFTTREVQVSIGRNDNLESGAFERYAPKEGSTFGTLVFNTNCGGLAGEYPLKGWFIGESLNAHGVEWTDQGVRFNAATNANSALTFGGRPVTLAGGWHQELVSGYGYRVE